MRETYQLQWNLAGEWKPVCTGLSWKEANDEWDNVKHHAEETIRLRVVRERDGFVMMGEGTGVGSPYTHVSVR